MSGQATLQNFNGMRAIVLSREDDPAQPLAAGLGRLGITTEFRGPMPAFPEGLQADRDLLLVEGDLDLRGLIQRAEARELDAVPVIGLVGVEAPGRLRALIALGATAFIRLPVYQPTIYQAVFLAVNTHRQRRRLMLEIAAHDRRRRGRRDVMKAVIATMNRDGIDDDTAYEQLRRTAMRSRRSIEDYCQSLLERPEADAASAEALRPRSST